MMSVASILIVGALFLGGCLVVPVDYHVSGSRKNVSEEARSVLEPGVTTKEEVFLRLGEPDYASRDSRLLAYTWTKARAVWFLLPDPRLGAGVITRGYVLQVWFDASNRVSRVAVIESRLPIADVPPVANGSCTVTVLRKREFKGSALTHYVSLDGATIAMLEAGQYTRFSIAEGRHALQVVWFGPEGWPPRLVLLRGNATAVDCAPPGAHSVIIQAHPFALDPTERVRIISLDRREGEFRLEGKQYVPPGPRPAR